MIAALYVETDGCYFDIPGVDPWDETRDARLYAGPWPVVAHPPCKTWSLMSNCRPEIRKGDDGGCFMMALAAVRVFGGVLEHPAHSAAWLAFHLPKPPARGGWIPEMFRGGWVASVDQRHYGHRANKPTWLYYHGRCPPPVLTWGRAPRGEVTARNDGGGGRDQRSKTPPAFRDLLLSMARSASRAEAA